VKPGDSVEVCRAFSKRDINDYAMLSGHKVVGEQVPEPLIGALFSYLLGVKLPGMGTNYLKQETRYQASAVTGEALTAEVKITRLRPYKQLVDLATICRRADGSIIADGRALVYVGDLKTRTSHTI
jgi:3-hydroxybutyryl-CoA dehydratase